MIVIDAEDFDAGWQRLLPLGNKTRPHVIPSQLLDPPPKLGSTSGVGSSIGNVVEGGETKLIGRVAEPLSAGFSPPKELIVKLRHRRRIVHQGWAIFRATHRHRGRSTSPVISRPRRFKDKTPAVFVLPLTGTRDTSTTMH